MRSVTVQQNIRPILAAIRSVPVPQHPALPKPEPVRPFMTMSRQPGVGAWTLAQESVAAINAANPDSPAWTSWDRELIDKVAADHHLSTQLLESLEDSSHSWLSDFLAGISFSNYPDDVMLYHRVASTIRALAQAGRVVIVGHGALFITQSMPGGIHVRAIAPREWRVQRVMQHMEMNADDASEWITEQEHNRQAFYGRFWPKQKLDEQMFHLTINLAKVPSAEAIELLTTLVRMPVNAPSEVAS